MQRHAYEALEKYPWCIGELIRILLSRTVEARWARKKKGNLLEKQHMARLVVVNRSPTAFEVSGMKEADVLEFTWLLCLPLSLWGYFLSLPLVSLSLPLPYFSFRGDLTKRATIPRSIPPSASGVVFRSLEMTTVTEDVGQTSVWMFQLNYCRTVTREHQRGLKDFSRMFGKHFEIVLTSLITILNILKFGGGGTVTTIRIYLHLFSFLYICTYVHRARFDARREIFIQVTFSQIIHCWTRQRYILQERSYVLVTIRGSLERDRYERLRNIDEKSLAYIYRAAGSCLGILSLPSAT